MLGVCERKLRGCMRLAPLVGKRPPARALARGLALFFGAFALLSALAPASRVLAEGDMWWLDMRFLPLPGARLLALPCAALLFAWGVIPEAARLRRLLTSAACAFLALAALVNTRDFYGAWLSSAIRPALPMPWSLPVAAAFLFVGRAVIGNDSPPLAKERRAIVVTLLVLAIVFPLAQVAFLGTTDYRRRADAAVVLGALVLPSGQLSCALEDRVRTAAGLYHDGLVRKLVMSGGTGKSGVDEAEAMRDRAVELGVPAEAILLDSAGTNTDATVRDTVWIFRANGIRRVIAVSQFYHLPRVKLAYRSAGQEVWTVPAEARRYLTETPQMVLREVPAFWTYWLRDLAGLALL